MITNIRTRSGQWDLFLPEVLSRRECQNSHTAPLDTSLHAWGRHAPKEKSGVNKFLFGSVAYLATRSFVYTAAFGRGRRMAE